MSCCGQHRDSMRMPGPTVQPAQVALPLHFATTSSRGSMWNPASLALAGHGVRLRYRDQAPMRVRGPVTGRHYEFSVMQPIHAVDKRDVDSLVRTRLFSRAI